MQGDLSSLDAVPWQPSGRYPDPNENPKTVAFSETS